MKVTIVPPEQPEEIVRIEMSYSEAQELRGILGCSDWQVTDGSVCQKLFNVLNDSVVRSSVESKLKIVRR